VNRLLWLDDLESLEAISQDDYTRRLFLRMAQLSQQGRLTPFLHELDADGELDAETKAMLAELARDSSFLHAVEDYVLRTRAQH
jgi:type IV secretory pathway TrbF-like protein